jgi:pimeloyl-ACP methyl ester carboxylesterase
MTLNPARARDESAGVRDSIAEEGIMSIQEKTVQIGECSLHCLCSQAEGARDVLLLHGASFEAATWQQLGTLDRLEHEGFRPIGLDLPGYGRSPVCDADPVQLLSGFVALEARSLPVVIGPSMGGRVALELTLERPEQVGGLVLVGAVGVQALRDRLSEIDVPTLIVWGSEDEISSLDNGYVLEQEVEDSRYVVLHGASHPCYLDQPQRWHEELIRFLSERYTEPGL